VRKRGKASFDPKEFLAKVGEGKTISKYRKDQVVFSQGQVADAVFYIQQGKVKLTVVSEQGKEAVVAILGPGHFFWRRMSEWPSAAYRNNAGGR
jgi:CRP/FNR family cyclic AMP-dependent transcriptional regulator